MKMFGGYFGNLRHGHASIASVKPTMVHRLDISIHLLNADTRKLAEVILLVRQDTSTHKGMDESADLSTNTLCTATEHHNIYGN